MNVRKNILTVSVAKLVWLWNIFCSFLTLLSREGEMCANTDSVGASECSIPCLPKRLVGDRSLKAAATECAAGAIIATAGRVALALFGTLLLYDSYSQDLYFSPICTVQGNIAIEGYRQDGTPKPSHTTFYEVSKDGLGNWTIYMIVPGDNEYLGIPNGGKYYYHMSCDGTSIFSIYHSTVYFVNDEAVIVDEEEMQNSPIVGIEYGPFPTEVSVDTTVLPIWLMYIGGDYIKSHPGTRIPNVTWPLTMSKIPWSCDFQYEWHSDTSVFKRGIFSVNQSLLSKDFSDYPEVDISDDMSTLHYEIDLYSNMINKSALICSDFEVNDIVLSNNVALPKYAKFNSYWFDSNNTQDNILIRGYYLSTTNVIYHDHDYKRKLLPELTSDDILVEDRRFRYRDDRSYMDRHWYPITNKIWTVSTNDPRILAMLAQQGGIRKSIYGYKFDGIVYHVVVGLCIMALLMPVYFKIRKWRRRHVESGSGGSSEP